MTPYDELVERLRQACKDTLHDANAREGIVSLHVDSLRQMLPSIGFVSAAPAPNTYARAFADAVQQLAPRYRRMVQS